MAMDFSCMIIPVEKETLFFDMQLPIGILDIRCGTLPTMK
jgi:hypothetical protein